MIVVDTSAIVAVLFREEPHSRELALAPGAADPGPRHCAASPRTYTAPRGTAEPEVDWANTAAAGTFSAFSTTGCRCGVA